MAALIRSASLTNYAEIARKLGLDPARMLAECRLPARCLRDAELKVPIDAVRTLLEASAERSGVEAFGLLMADTRRLSNLGPVGLLIREQPTLRDALQALRLYTRQLNGALFLTIEEIGDVALIREEIIVGHGGPIRQSTELAIGVVFRVLQTIIGPQWRPLRVCFSHDPPVDRTEHNRLFNCRVEFGHAFNGVVCSRRDLDIANPNADPGIAKLALQMLEASPQVAGDELSGQVRRLVLGLLGTGACNIEAIAQHLGVDRRTVHRRLSHEGHTFSEIIAEVRRELAARYLADPQRSLAEISSLLGFSSLSGFSRWHRQQFGTSATEQRNRTSTP